LKEKHAVKPGCSSEKCKKKCTTKISEERRNEINCLYWELNWIEQKSFVLNSLSRTGVKRRTSVRQTEEFQRKNTFQYFLKDADGQKQNVCKLFFLTTLGYNKKNDWIIKGLVKTNIDSTPTSSLRPHLDQRGRKACKTKIPKESIADIIESFQPTISHYRREHAPNRKYLPSDLTIQSMYNDYLKSHSQNKCSYEVYRKMVKNSNISFTNLGHEECEQCEGFKLHNNQHNLENLNMECETCKNWKDHINRAEKSRKCYRIDVENTDSNTIIMSVDLQKVIMLPRLDMFKKAIFTQRISVFNESFVPLGKLQKHNNIIPFACLWHEGIAGRAKEEIISIFYSFFLHFRDTKHLILWVDNCAGQNKNWTLFSFLVYIVNSDVIAAEDIIIKYFEPGHTFMSDDSFHHQVELSLKRQKKTYDFIGALQESNSSKVTIKEMTPCDFFK